MRQKRRFTPGRSDQEGRYALLKHKRKTDCSPYRAIKNTYKKDVPLKGVLFKIYRLNFLKSIS